MHHLSMINNTTQYFGEIGYIHNDTSLRDFFSNDKIGIFERSIIHFIFFYNKPRNQLKDPKNRIIVSNPGIMRLLGHDLPQKGAYLTQLYKDRLSGIQSMLERAELEDIWMREFKNSLGQWIPLRTKNDDGFYEVNPEALGCTERRIVLNVPKIKEWITITPELAKVIGYKDRSKAKRFFNKRPITLKDYLLNEFIKTIAKDKVKEVKISKEVLNDYLEKQYKKYADFSGLTAEDKDIVVATKKAVEILTFYVYEAPPDIIDTLLGVKPE